MWQISLSPNSDSQQMRQRRRGRHERDAPAGMYSSYTGQWPLVGEEIPCRAGTRRYYLEGPQSDVSVSPRGHMTAGSQLLLGSNCL